MLARKKIPNYLTFARVAAVPASLFVMHVPAPHVALFVIFLFASLTDFLDGFLARRWHVTSKFGAFLDPLADKLLVALLLIYLLQTTELPLFPVALILLREIYISGLREFLGTQRVTLPVSSGGKIKTALQMLAITIMLLQPILAIPALLPFGSLILTIAATFGIVSAVQYTIASWKYLR